MKEYEIQCPKCRALLQVEETELGKPATCPGCTTAFRLPPPPDKPTPYETLLAAKAAAIEKYDKARPALTATRRITISILFTIWKIIAFITRIAWKILIFFLGSKKKAPVPWGSEPATERQLGFIDHLGGQPDPTLTKAEASVFIDQLLNRKR